MKPLTVHLPEDIYDRAERRAVDGGTTLPGEVVKLVARYSEGNGEGVDRGGSQAPMGVELQDLIRDLSAIGNECRDSNWNAQGAAPVKQETLLHARRFVEVLPSGYPLPSAGVEPDGHVTLEWYRNRNWTLSVSVSPESDLYYAALFVNNDVRGRESFTGDVPDIILALIKRVQASGNPPDKMGPPAY